MISTKSIYDSVSPEDGLRVLVARYYPRGIKKERFDKWMRDLSPSPELLRKYRSGAISWSDFSRRFVKELASNAESKSAIKDVLVASKQGPVTFLCYEREGERCHRQVLKKLLERRRTD